MKPGRPHSTGWESLGSHRSVCACGVGDGDASCSHQAGAPQRPEGEGAPYSTCISIVALRQAALLFSQRRDRQEVSDLSWF